MQDNNLPELRDIHLPEGVPAFPPGYGWGIILFAVVLVIVLIHLIMVLRRKSKKRYALYLLNNIYCNNTISSVVQMSEILRRVCVFKYKEAAVLSGDEWIAFLNSKQKVPLTGKAAELLINAPYIPEETKGYSKDDVIKVRKFCREWIGENL
ncbi:MAG: DUF4381 domain-containing protein [Alphaproteobacteria bacterium]|nr:DUF4381 domain-containing protein [Alphaproteobacteria bacterium]